jgi:hypothetical protein
MRWGGGGGGGLRGLSSHGAQINFRDETPYFTYDFWPCFLPPIRKNKKNKKRKWHDIRPPHLRNVVVVLIDHVVRAAQVVEMMVVPVLLIIVIII